MTGLREGVTTDHAKIKEGIFIYVTDFINRRRQGKRANRKIAISGNRKLIVFLQFIFSIKY